MKEQISLRVLPWLNEELRNMSRERGISKNSFITTAIIEKLKKERGK